MRHGVDDCVVDGADSGRLSPDSPTPVTPSGLFGVRVTVCPVSNDGRSAAPGITYSALVRARMSHG